MAKKQYKNIVDVTIAVLEKLVKKEERLLNELLETRVNIKIVENQINGGASLDKWFEDFKARAERELSSEDTKVTIERGIK